jgi:hypothetical protein
MTEGVTRWKIASVLDDLEASVKQTADEACRSRLSAVIGMLAPERSGQGST